MHQLTFAATIYRSIRDRIRTQDPQIDEQALADQALATGLEGRIGEMEARRDHLQEQSRQASSDRQRCDGRA